MIYTTAVELARSHFEELLASYIKLIHAGNYPTYSKLDPNELVLRIKPVLEHHLHYLETGDITDWKNFCIYVISLRVRQGLDYSEIITLNKDLLEYIMGFFREHLASFANNLEGLPAQKYLQSLENRLNGLHGVAISTATATSMKVKRELNQVQQ